MFICEVCSNEFSSKRVLIDHLATQENLVIFCDKCGKSFTSSRLLQQHMNNYHSKGDFACDQCKQIFTQKYKLKEHIWFKHDGDTFPCIECTKKYRSRQKLRYHKLTCNKDPSHIMKHVCPKEYCKKEFIRNYSLKAHIKKILRKRKKVLFFPVMNARHHFHKKIH